MTRQLLFFLFAFVGLSISAQVIKPISWKVNLSEEDPAVGDTVAVRFEASIDEKWYLYSSDFDPNLGPIVTTFEFTPHPSYELVGDLTPVDPKKKYDSLWEGEYTYFKEEGLFIQKVKILDPEYVIAGSYNYQVCSDIDGKCIPFDEEFDLKKKAGDESTEPVVLTGDSPPNAMGLWSFVMVAFLAGLAALITPCVFPMIPMTVTFFMRGEDKSVLSGAKKGMIFGISIILIYTILGTLFAIILGADGLNALATHWLPNTFIFVVFIIFALSFFGLFEINLPTSLVNRMDRQADKGGLIGVFFMAFTLALVSFSCTVPIVGSVLILSVGGEIIRPVLGMFSFAMAFAIPFTAFAIFPKWLKSLPKSGGWLNSVKVVLAFLELALAFKFLSIADQAYHWGILDREIYLALWIVIFLLMGLYLLGKIRLPGDSPIEKVSVLRLILAIVVFTFVTYLIPGMWGAPLKALAGYLPPLSTHDFNLMARTGPVAADTEDNLCETPKHADFLHWPHGLQGYFDYEQALKCAREARKPIFIDFTGHGCVNCREMEQRVWSDPQVLKRLNEDFILLALYVDDKTTLPEPDWYRSEYDGKLKKTIGKQNADFQITRFNNNAQPYYVIISPDEKLLVSPTAYELKISNFIAFLDKGLENYNKTAGTLKSKK